MQVSNLIFIIVLIISIILHEIAHGYMADRLGDPTARLRGRLSLNPLVHIDWLGSVILPLFLVFTGSPFLIGWAKPVPFNPYNMKNPKWGGVLVALAGPLTNLLLAVIFALALKFLSLSVGFVFLFNSIILTNLALAVFNLVPIPPLDGHHILYALLPEDAHAVKEFLRRYSFIILIAFIFYGWQFISPIISGLYSFLV